jgi:hypothetical protein
MKITIICEGKTEKAFLPYLRNFLQSRLSGKMPKLDPYPCDGRIPTKDKLKRVVENLLRGRDASDHVIALTDVYPFFTDAKVAKNQMREWVGEEPNFHPHAAQFEFEAWLLPYWSTIQKLAGHNQKAPGSNPEEVNHNNPPAHRIREIFELGKNRESYCKP